MTAFIVFVGICGTSGSELAFGEAFWDPSILVSHFGNPAVVIIFSLFIILATLTTNVACNLAAASVVFSSLFGKVLTYKRPSWWPRSSPSASCPGNWLRIPRATCIL